MKKIKCIIVDDEPIAIRIIRSHLNNFDEFEVYAECSDALCAMKILRNESIDLIFLDIEMPTLNGLEMIKSLSTPPSVIFTTAHRNYAVEAFDIDALDYLLKPISFDRFTQAINRFLSQRSNLSAPASSIEEKNKSLVVKADKKNIKLNTDNIDFIESLADYVIIHSDDKKIVTKERISSLEERLADYRFLRVHRGFLVNTKKVTAWYGNTLELGNAKIPIGRNYKDAVLDLFYGEKNAFAGKSGKNT